MDEKKTCQCRLAYRGLADIYLIPRVCGRPAVSERGFCKMHDPETMPKRDKRGRIISKNALIGAPEKPAEPTLPPVPMVLGLTVAERLEIGKSDEGKDALAALEGARNLLGRLERALQDRRGDRSEGGLIMFKNNGRWSVVRTIYKRVPLDGGPLDRCSGFTTKADGRETVFFDLEIDLEKLAGALGWKIVRSTTGKATLAHGAIRARVSSRVRE